MSASPHESGTFVHCPFRRCHWEVKTAGLADDDYHLERELVDIEICEHLREAHSEVIEAMHRTVRPTQEDS